VSCINDAISRRYSEINEVNLHSARRLQIKSMREGIVDWVRVAGCAHADIGGWKQDRYGHAA
jgi:hypothetical protein